MSEIHRKKMAPLSIRLRTILHPPSTYTTCTDAYSEGKVVFFQCKLSLLNGILLSEHFNVHICNVDSYGDEVLFLIGAFIFEDVGVTAYHGAVGLISPALTPVSI